jgi:hypothetical protein
MQEYVQKSTNTTLPRSDAAVSGGEFNQSTPPESEGNVASTGSASAAGIPFGFIRRIVVAVCRRLSAHHRLGAVHRGGGLAARVQAILAVRGADRAQSLWIAHRGGDLGVRRVSP